MHGLIFTIYNMKVSGLDPGCGTPSPVPRSTPGLGYPLHLLKRVHACALQLATFVRETVILDTANAPNVHMFSTNTL